jgi:hypothetical protein
MAITGYMLDKGGIVIRFSGGARNVYCPKGLDQLWGSPSPHLDGYLTLVRRVQSGRTINLTGHFQLIARLRINASRTQFTHPPSLHARRQLYFVPPPYKFQPVNVD